MKKEEGVLKDWIGFGDEGGRLGRDLDLGLGRDCVLDCILFYHINPSQNRQLHVTSYNLLNRACYYCVTCLLRICICWIYVRQGM
jgi:hypothetical protein